jgi:RNA polymerase sigma factor (sigma-70 family)
LTAVLEYQLSELNVSEGGIMYALQTFLHDLRERDLGNLPDADLLERFAATRDDAAFEAMVRRHGPMVLSLCRRVLNRNQDIEDAFQATFLVLVRKADAIGRRNLLGNWLYGVACRVAKQARASSARWRFASGETLDAIPERSGRDRFGDDLPILDEELSKLPDKYRVPLVLCYLQGKTNKEAAAQIGCPEGSMSDRLSRARDLLRRRLTGRGIVLSAGASTMLLNAESTSASVPADLVASTLRFAGLLAAGEGGPLPAQVVAVTTLARAVSRTMALGRLKAVVALLATVGLVCGGAGVLARQSLTVSQETRTGRVVDTRDRSLTDLQASQSQAALNEALQQARNLAPSTQKVWMILDIARNHASANQPAESAAAFQQALRAALETESDHRLLDVAECAIQLGDAGAADIVLDGLDDVSQRKFAQLAMSKAHAVRKEWSSARALVENLHGEYRNEALTAIAHSQLSAGDLRAARATAENLGPASRSMILAAISLRELRSGDKAVLLQEARAASQNAGKQDGWARAALVGVLAEAGKLEVARTLADSLQDPGCRNPAYQNVAIGQITRGDFAGARQSIDRIQTENLQAETLVQLVAGLMKANEPKQALETADAIKSPQWRGYGWIEIGKAHARSGQKDQAALALRRAFQEAKAVEVTETNGYIGLYLLAHVAKAQAAAGLADEARAWIAQASPQIVRAAALVALGKGLAEPRRALEPLRTGYQYENEQEPFTGTIRLLSAKPDVDEAGVRALLDRRKEVRSPAKFPAFQFGPNATFRGWLTLFSGERVLFMSPDASAFEVILELKKGQNIDFGRVSPDGRSLAYSVRPAKDAAEEIWMLETNGTHRKVGNHGYVKAWSPDGKKLACFRGDANYRWENFVIDLATGQEAKLAIPEADLVDDWSPDGQWLAVMAGNPDKTFEHPTKGTYPQRRIYLVHPDGIGRRDLTVDSTIPVDNIDARFSPDGKKLVWHQRTHHGLKVLHAVAIYTLHVDQPAREVFQFDTFFRGNKQFKSNGSPCWSSDGTQTVWYVPRQLLEESSVIPELIFVSSGDGSTRRMNLRDKGLHWVGGFDWR